MQTIRIKGLPDGTFPDKEFEFYVDELTVRIPGDHRGPDVCIADYPEQEHWVDQQKDLLKPSWDCEWQLADADAATKFMARLCRAIP